MSKFFDKFKRKFYYTPFGQISFSQEGEDMILKSVFENRSSGYYIDIGAHHPIRFSTTYFFYLQGWRGINIESMPGSIEIFNKYRHRDINLELAISNEKGHLIYYEFNDSALNTFSKDLALERARNTHYKIINTEELPTYPLREILDIYLPSNQEIDFLNVDVEGYDLKVLESNDWVKYHPTIVLVEDLSIKSLENYWESDIVCYLSKQKYQLLAKTLRTLLFRST